MIVYVVCAFVRAVFSELATAHCAYFYTLTVMNIASYSNFIL